MDETGALRGQFLVAGRNLRDPNFFKSVVLIVDHSDSGAVGLIVNRPTSIDVAEALGKQQEEPKSDCKVYVGGPVSPTALFVLHNSRLLDPDAANVVPGVFLASQPRVFKEVVEHARSGADSGKLKKFAYRVLCGCAGWGPGQLEAELSHSDWLIVPAAEQHVFASEPHVLWEALYQDALRNESLVPHLPGDPDLN